MSKLVIPRFADASVESVSLDQFSVPQALINLLAERPRKVLDLAEILDRSPARIGIHLVRLEAMNKAHRVRVTTASGFHYVWYSGPAGRYVAPLPLEPEPEEEDPTAGQPRQTIVSVYTIDTPRDPWIAALFGPAHREAA